MTKVVNMEENSNSFEPENNEPTVEKSEMVEKLVLKINDRLVNSDVSDDELSKPTPFGELFADTIPIEPLPTDFIDDLVYQSRYEGRCLLCRSPWRVRAEHVYIKNGRKPQAVVNFFVKHFNSKPTWESVKTHMDQHCVLTHVSIGGLKRYEKRDQDLGPWKYKERDLAMTIILSEIDDVGGIDCSRNPDIQLKKSQRLESLAKMLSALQKERDEAGSNSLNIFQIMLNLHDSLVCDEDRRKVRDTVKRIREQLSDA